MNLIKFCASSAALLFLCSCDSNDVSLAFNTQNAPVQKYFLESSLDAMLPSDSGVTVPEAMETHLKVQATLSELVAYDNGSATVVKIEATGDGNMAPIGTAHDENNNEVTDITIGDGTNGVLDNKNGQKIITLQIDNGSKKVIIKANALKNSKVTKVIIKGQKSKFEKNVFKGTKKKTCRIYLKGAKKAKDVSIAKGAFNGLGKNSKVYLSKKMDKKEYKKLVNKLRKAGFKGKIVRN